MMASQVKYLFSAQWKDNFLRAHKTRSWNFPQQRLKTGSILLKGNQNNIKKTCARFNVAGLL